MEPVVGLCDPDCPRACWTRDHLDVYRRLEGEAEELSRRNRVSPPQREVLRRQAETFRRRIAAIEEATRGQAG